MSPDINRSQTDPTPYGVKQITPAYAAVAGGRAPRQPLPCSPLANGSDLAAEYEFFTPALLHLYGRVVEAAWADVVHAHPGLVYYFVKFDLPLFSGLQSESGSVDWNHVLFGVRRAYYPHVLRHLANCVMFDPVEKIVLRYFPQDVRLLDPFRLRRDRIVTTETPVLSITGFGVTGPDWKIGFVPPADLKAGKPTAYRVRSSGRSREYAAAVVAGENPLRQTVKDSWKYALDRWQMKLLKGDIDQVEM